MEYQIADGVFISVSENPSSIKVTIINDTDNTVNIIDNSPIIHPFDAYLPPHSRYEGCIPMEYEIIAHSKMNELFILHND